MERARRLDLGLAIAAGWGFASTGFVAAAFAAGGMFAFPTSLIFDRASRKNINIVKVPPNRKPQRRVKVGALARDTTVAAVSALPEDAFTAAAQGILLEEL
jgi:hypothetical protein